MNVVVPSPVAWWRAATTSEESMPPLSNAATGTSATDCEPTASSSAVETSSAQPSSVQRAFGRACTAWNALSRAPRASITMIVPGASAATFANPVAGSGT